MMWVCICQGSWETKLWKEKTYDLTNIIVKYVEHKNEKDMEPVI